MKNFKKNFGCCCFVFFSILSNQGYGQKLMDGPCHGVKPVPDFDFKRYLGRWYEVYRTPYQLEDGEKCIEFHYSDTADQGKYIVSRLSVEDEKFNQTRKVTINKKTGEGISIEAYPFTILDTDYDKYAVVHACRGTGPHIEITWILTRERKINSKKDKDIVENSIKALVKNHIDTAHPLVARVDQTDCPDNYDDAKKY